MLKVRLANSSDIKKVFELSNDDVVRANSINKFKISWENHVKWFNNHIKDLEHPFYIIENDNGDFVGQVRFDTAKENVISISISKNFRGKGLASDIIKICTQKSNLKSIYAYVKITNIASKKAFIKAGYKELGIEQINNEDYFKLSF